MTSTKQNNEPAFLFFDLEVTGHHVEYISHLINYRIQGNSAGKFILLIHPKAVERLADLNLPVNWSKSVVIEHPNDKEQQILDKTKSKIQKANKELKIVKRIGEKHQVGTCFLMCLNRYQFVLGGRVGKSLPGNIRGILFNPLGKTGKLLNDFLLGPRKKAQISWMLRNKKINRIFILNDEEKADELNKCHRKRRLFKSLPDPVQPLSSHQICVVSSTRKNQDYGKTKFLLFGSLTKRKGIFTVLDALDILPHNLSPHIEFIFAGNLNKKDRENFIFRLNRLKENNPELEINLIDYFLSNTEAANLFSVSDFILAPYIGSEASSGIIGHAAFYKKPVIGPSSGLIGKLIKKYELGLAISPMCAKSLSSTIEEIISEKVVIKQSKGMEKFIYERFPKKFVISLIS